MANILSLRDARKASTPDGKAAMQRVYLHKLRRKMANATWMYDRIQLRQPIGICPGCEHRMPWKWAKKFEYEKVEAFHGAECPCDYCREVTNVNFFLPGEGAVWKETEKAMRQTAQVRARERALFMKEPRNFAGV